MNKIPLLLVPHNRKAWKPVTRKGDKIGSGSKFSGKPWLAKGETYPECQNCGKPMQLFLQLNLQDLPKPLLGEFGEGLLQMFYCTNSEPACEVDCEAFFPFAKSELLRVIQPKGEPQEIDEALPVDSFPARTITGWKELNDYPNWEEAEQLGLELSDDEIEAMEDYYPISGDKLGGWPNWVQGVEYPACPSCGETMRLVFQLDSEDNLPYMFGDVGCGHITQCKTHKEQVAFGWACG
jgi:uncharacterized protein YwqG